MAEKREDIKIPYNGIITDAEKIKYFILNGKIYTSLVQIYNDGYNNGFSNFRDIDNKYKEGFDDGYKKGRQECTESFNAGYDIGYRAGKEI